MKFLFVKLKHIGDSLLLTPMIRSVRMAYPQSQIWVVVRKGCEGILAGSPDIDQILTAAAPEKTRRRPWDFAAAFKLGATIRAQRFDYAFELGDGDRGRWLTLLSRARHRCANAAGRPLHWWWRRMFTDFSPYWWYKSHQVEKDFFTVSDCLPKPLPQPIPKLVFSRNHVRSWPPAENLAKFAVLHPGTRWTIKRWQEHRWQELCGRLLERVPAIVLSCGPDPEEVRLCAALSQSAPGRILSTSGQTSWAQLAGLLHRAALFVGVDTAAMHLAAACSCPTVALFMNSSPTEWAPWQTRHVVIQPESAQASPFRTPAERISVTMVLRACDELLRNEEQP